MTAKLNFEDISSFFQEQNCKLLSNSYKNSNTKLDYICICGNTSVATWNSFRKGCRCKNCRNIINYKKQALNYNYVKESFKLKGCELLSLDYKNAHSKLEFICNCGEKNFATWASFSQNHKCKKCGIKKRSDATRTSYEYIKNYFKINDCELLSQSFQNSKTKMDYICVCKREAKITWDKFRQGKRCSKCAADKLRGPNHPRWNADRNVIKIRKRYYSLIRRTLATTDLKKDKKSKELLGYTPYDLKFHINNHPNWNKIKDKKWHIDHIFPLQAFMEHKIYDIKIINALDNLQPLEEAENLKKTNNYSKKDFYEYLLKKGYHEF